MIPEFPKFKRLELSDKKDIQNFTKNFQPYSDFNFETMWAWDIDGSTRISQLNGNLVAILKNHLTNEICITFMGTNEVNPTISQLLKFSNNQSEVKIDSLSLVPEISLLGLNFNQYYIEIELGHCDYIYNIGNLAKMSGKSYSRKRESVNYFNKNNSDIKLEHLNLSAHGVKDLILSLTKTWEQNKTIKHKLYNHEVNAISRLTEGNLNDNFIFLLKNNNKLVAYSIYSTTKDFVISHFVKADINYYGIYEFLMHETAKIWSNKFQYLNYQEDLGIEGLRFSKSSYNPIGFLRKYKIKKL